MGGMFIQGVDSQPRKREFHNLLIEKAWRARQAQSRNVILVSWSKMGTSAFLYPTLQEAWVPCSLPESYDKSQQPTEPDGCDHAVAVAATEIVVKLLRINVFRQPTCFTRTTGPPPQ